MLHELEVTVEDEERGGGFPGGVVARGQGFLEAWGEAAGRRPSLGGAVGCEVDAVLGSGRQAE